MENQPNLSIIKFIGIAILIDVLLVLFFWAAIYPLYYWISDMTLLWKILTFILLGSIILTGIRYLCIWGQHNFFEYILRLGETMARKIYLMSGLIFTINAILLLIALWVYAFKKDPIMIILLLIFSAIIGFVNSVFKFPSNT